MQGAHPARQHKLLQNNGPVMSSVCTEIIFVLPRFQASLQLGENQRCSMKQV